MFKARALSNGFRCERNYLSARYGPNRKVIITKSELDFRLTTQDGRIGFFDCKSFDSISFSFSDINKDQLKRSVDHNYWNVPSGFTVWFRLSNRVVYFKGSYINQKGPRTSFKDSEGIYLGSIENFSLKALMA